MTTSLTTLFLQCQQQPIPFAYAILRPRPRPRAYCFALVILFCLLPVLFMIKNFFIYSLQILHAEQNQKRRHMQRQGEDGKRKYYKENGNPVRVTTDRVVTEIEYRLSLRVYKITMRMRMMIRIMEMG